MAMQAAGLAWFEPRQFLKAPFNTSLTLNVGYHWTMACYARAALPDSQIHGQNAEYGNLRAVSPCEQCHLWFFVSLELIKDSAQARLNLRQMLVNHKCKKTHLAAIDEN
jgi:hypothetical protein